VHVSHATYPSSNKKTGLKSWVNPVFTADGAFPL
jgi:hypothetical protein